MSTKNYSKEALQQWHNDSVRETYLMYNSNTDIMNASYTLHEEDLQDAIINKKNSNDDINLNSKNNKYTNKDNKMDEDFDGKNNNNNSMNNLNHKTYSPSPSLSPSSSFLLNDKSDKMMESVQQPFNILLKNPETSNGNYAYILNIKKNDTDEKPNISNNNEFEDDYEEEEDDDDDESFQFDEDNEQEINNIEYDGNKRIKINKDSLEQSWVNLHDDINTSDNIYLKRKLKTDEISKKKFRQFLSRKEKIKPKEKSDINNKIKTSNIRNKDTNKILHTNYNSLESSIISYNSSDISSPSPKNINANLTTSTNNNNNNFDIELDQHNIPEKFLLDEVNNFLKNHADQIKDDKKFITISSTACSSSDFLEERFIQENSMQKNSSNSNVSNKDNTDNNDNKNDDDLNGVLFQIGCISVIIAGISLSVGLIIGTRHRLL
ncbi:hypothetical protein BVG19_g1453 [[Candida] boidinii]|nr:hypothetical protein BVG19_g1453 [[Candida] boidinii]OWB54084.1 hypothetical protein B5S27_g5713 [[Candida] boidinii]